MKYAPPFALWHRISRNTLPPRLGNLPLGGYGRGWTHVLWPNCATTAGKDTNSQPHIQGRMGSAIHLRFLRIWSGRLGRWPCTGTGLRRRRRSSGCRAGISRLSYVHFLAFIQRVRRIQDNPVATLEPLKHFQRCAVIAANAQRPQVNLVISVHYHGAKTFGTKQERVHWNSQTRRSHLHLQMNLRISPW